MMLSIIIITCNRLDSLSTCLFSLKKACEGIRIDNYEIIVSDDSSVNATEEYLKIQFPKIQYLKGPRKGPAANRNNAAKNAKGEWLIFIDDDCVVMKPLISAYVTAFKENPTTFAFEGKVNHERPQERFNESAPINLNGGLFWTCNVAIQRNLFLELGCFDERLGMSMEDVAFRELLKKKTIPFVFVSEAIVIHPWKRETIQWMLKDSINKYHSTLMYKKYYPEISKNINTKHYFKSVGYRLFYCLKKIIPYKGRGLHVLLVQSMVDLYHGLKLNFDLNR